MFKKIVYGLVAIAVVLHLIGLALGRSHLPEVHGATAKAAPSA